VVQHDVSGSETLRLYKKLSSTNDITRTTVTVHTGILMMTKKMMKNVTKAPRRAASAPVPVISRRAARPFLRLLCLALACAVRRALCAVRCAPCAVRRALNLNGPVSPFSLTEGWEGVYYCRTYEKAVDGGGEREKGGHVLRDTTSRRLYVRVWPSH